MEKELEDCSHTRAVYVIVAIMAQTNIKLGDQRYGLQIAQNFAPVNFQGRSSS